MIARKLTAEAKFHNDVVIKIQNLATVTEIAALFVDETVSQVKGKMEALDNIYIHLVSWAVKTSEEGASDGKAELAVRFLSLVDNEDEATMISYLASAFGYFGYEMKIIPSALCAKVMVLDVSID